MAVVLATAPGLRRSGHIYDDRTGLSYEYPTARYRSLITSGERFVYQRPRGGYTGVGLIGEIGPSAEPDRSVAQILSYTPFTTEVPLRRPAGAYYESDPRFWRTDNIYWAQGVRPLAEDRLDEILAAGDAESPVTPAAASPGSLPLGPAYAADDAAKQVDRYAVAVAASRLKERFPNMLVSPMPHNNPGFDIRVGDATNPVLVVEVKGTRSAEPVFFLTEAERLFSATQARIYELVVICGVDLTASSHDAEYWHSGPITQAVAELRAQEWRCRLFIRNSATSLHLKRG